MDDTLKAARFYAARTPPPRIPRAADRGTRHEAPRRTGHRTRRAHPAPRRAVRQAHACRRDRRPPRGGRPLAGVGARADHAGVLQGRCDPALGPSGSHGRACTSGQQRDRRDACRLRQVTGLPAARADRGAARQHGALPGADPGPGRGPGPRHPGAWHPRSVRGRGRWRHPRRRPRAGQDPRKLPAHHPGHAASRAATTALAVGGVLRPAALRDRGRVPRVPRCVRFPRRPRAAAAAAGGRPPRPPAPGQGPAGCRGTRTAWSSCSRRPPSASRATAPACSPGRPPRRSPRAPPPAGRSRSGCGSRRSPPPAARAVPRSAARRPPRRPRCWPTWWRTTCAGSPSPGHGAAPRRWR